MSPLGIMKKLVNTLVKITLENIVEKIPIERVNAKPFIGPSPRRNKQKAAIRVVIFASKIDDRALLKPSSIACFKPFYCI